METRLGRYLNRLRFPLNGFRAFFLPLLLLNLFLCVCLSAQTANLALPHPIPPPAAEDPPPAQRQTVSKPATTQSAQQKPASTSTTKPAASTSKTTTTSPSAVQPKPGTNAASTVAPSGRALSADDQVTRILPSPRSSRFG